MENLKYIRLFLLTLLVVTGRLYALQIIAGPCLQSATETSVTILWITDANCTSRVEYGTDESLGQRAVSSQHGLIDANTKIRKITLNELTAGKTYYYKVCSKEIVKLAPYKVTYGQSVDSNVYCFTTLDSKKKEVSFLVFNDIHENNQMLVKMLDAAKEKPYDIVFLNGDMVRYLKSQQQIIEKVIQPCTQTFAKNVPVVYCRGNHELRGEFARQLPEYFTVLDNKFYGSFVHGPVCFIVMDSGEDKDDSNKEYGGLADFARYCKQQQQCLEKEIQSEAFKNAAFRVVLIHIPIDVGPKVEFVRPIYRRQWGPLFEKGKVDVMICGHTHQPEIVPPNTERSYPVIIGGGPLPAEKPRPEDYTTIRCDASQNELKIIITGFDGKIIDSYAVTKVKQEVLK